MISLSIMTEQWVSILNWNYLHAIARFLLPDRELINWRWFTSAKQSLREVDSYYITCWRSHEEGIKMQQCPPITRAAEYLGRGGPLSLSLSLVLATTLLPLSLFSHTHTHTRTRPHIHTYMHVYSTYGIIINHLVFPANVFSNWYNKTRRNAVTSFGRHQLSFEWKLARRVEEAGDFQFPPIRTRTRKIRSFRTGAG